MTLVPTLTASAGHSSGFDGKALSATDMWIGPASATPLFTTLGADDGGFRWVCGSSVVPPAPGAGK